MSFVPEAVQDENVLDSATTTFSVGKAGAAAYYFLITNPTAAGGSNLLLLLKATDTKAVYNIKPQQTIVCGPFVPANPPSVKSSSGTINNVLATPLRDGDGNAIGPFEIRELVVGGENYLAAIEAAEGSVVLFAADLNTFAELDTLIADKDLVNSDDGDGNDIFTQTFTTADFTAAGLTERVACTGFPANVKLIEGWCKLNTEFSGGAVASCDAELGDDGGTDDELMASTDVFTGAGTGLKFEDALADIGLKKAAYTPALTLTTTVANVDQLTAGSITVYVKFSRMGIA